LFSPFYHTYSFEPSVFYTFFIPLSSGTNKAEYLELSSGSSSAGHLASIIREVGYPFTFSVTVARAVFEKCGISRSNSFRTLQEDVIGHVLGMMANCPQGLREYSNIESFLPSKHGIDLKEVRLANQWNVDVFVKVVLEMVSVLFCISFLLE